MNHPGGSRSHLAIVSNMCHHIVARLALDFGDSGQIDVITSLLKCLDLLQGDGKSRLLFHLCQCDPHFTPGDRSSQRRKEFLHLDGGVSLRYRILVMVLIQWICGLSCQFGNRGNQRFSRVPKMPISTDGPR